MEAKAKSPKLDLGNKLEAKALHFGNKTLIATGSLYHPLNRLRRNLKLGNPQKQMDQVHCQLPRLARGIPVS